MMNNELWIMKLRETLSELADLEYQRRVWLGQSPNEVSSFEEAVCQLYDDYDLKGFLATRLENIENAAEIREIFESLETSIGAVDESLDPRVLIESPEMNSVRDVARRALGLLNIYFQK